MKQLSGLDALFLHAEMHGMPMHMSMLSIYDPSSKNTGVDFKDIIDYRTKRFYKERLEKLNPTANNQTGATHDKEFQ